ncbi:hypothetical protein QCE47_19205 [Caballeronia sp. LZ025]|uniref:hypothetical protein n=1 Tax=Caballeronia TaxID=1827195 RepID=UPI001FCFF6B0|nr:MULTISPECIES: hypothetical protein [Caballeronia]MDR5734439.1 hypothetical protein [Caballeronia sp. LZ025]
MLCERDYLPHDALLLGGIRGELLTHMCRRPERHDVSIYLRTSEDITLDAQVRHPPSARGLAIALEHYVALLSRLDTQLDTPLGGLDLNTPLLAARRRAWSHGGPLAAAPRDVLACFDDIVHAQPDAPALGGLE